MNPIKKKKAATITSIKNDCLALWSLCVRTRDRKCRICGSDQGLSAHHIRSRTHASTALDIENGMTVCWKKCHFLQKVNPERFQDMVIEVIGDDEYNRLKRKSQVVVKNTVKDLMAERDRLRSLLKELEDDYGAIDT